MDEIVGSNPASSQRPDTALFTSIGSIAQSIAIAVAISYVCGFVTVMAYLGDYGVHEYNALRAQYLIAGFLILALIGFFYHVVVRRVLALEQDGHNLQKEFRKLGKDTLSMGFAAVMYLLLDHQYVICIMTAMYCTMLFTWSSISVGLVAVFCAMSIGTYFIFIFPIINPPKNPKRLRAYLFEGGTSL